MSMEQRAQNIVAGESRARLIPLGNVTAGQKIAAVTGNEHRVVGDFAAPVHLIHCRPVLDMRHRGEIAGAAEITLKLGSRAPGAPVRRRIWDHRPPEAKVGRELARDLRFPITVDAVAVAKHVPAAKVAQHDDDQAGIVTTAQRNDNRPIAHIMKQPAKDALVRFHQRVDKSFRASGSDRSVAERVIATKRMRWLLAGIVEQTVAGRYLVQVLD